MSTKLVIDQFECRKCHLHAKLSEEGLCEFCRNLQSAIDQPFPWSGLLVIVAVGAFLFVVVMYLAQRPR
jgi:RNA polymerase subunit RPABC4/transcription elongation factor Spt4